MSKMISRTTEFDQCTEATRALLNIVAVQTRLRGLKGVLSTVRVLRLAIKVRHVVSVTI